MGWSGTDWPHFALNRSCGYRSLHPSICSKDGDYQVRRLWAGIYINWRFKALREHTAGCMCSADLLLKYQGSLPYSCIKEKTAFLLSTLTSKIPQPTDPPPSIQKEGWEDAWLRQTMPDAPALSREPQLPQPRFHGVGRVGGWEHKGSFLAVSGAVPS